jgi:DNA polymerase, archaea type
MYDKLIHGKSFLENIVSIEPSDSSAVVFTEINGIISQQTIPNRYWLLSPKPLDKSFVKLKGNLFYQFGRQFQTREEFLKYRNIYKRHNIFSIYNSTESLMVKDGYTLFKGMKVEDVSVLSFDIETVGLEHNENSKVLLISNTYRYQGQITRKLFCYNDYKTEKEFFDSWCSWVREINPSIMLGHNVIIYDLPYLSFCARKAGTELFLGRDSSKIKFVDYTSQFRKDGSQSYPYNKVHIYGREIVDTFFLSIKYDIGRKYESYKLKQIIKQEGLERKDRQFYDAATIKDNYLIPEEWKKIKNYCNEDSDDALALYDLMIPSFFYSTQSIPKSFQSIIESASGSQLNSIMIRSYLQEMHSLPATTAPEPFEGAISFGNPGIYQNVFKIDVASLYPSIMIQYEVYSPEKDPAGNFLQIVKYFTQERLKNKQLNKETGERYYKDLSESMKIFINSAYGFLGASGLLFNDPQKAAFVTEKGREILKTALSWAETKGFKIVNADTDSISFCKNDSSEFTNIEQIELLKEINLLCPEKIIWENDGIFSKIIIVKAKNYILQTPDGKVKIKGSGLKATMKEKALQQFIKEVINLLLDNKQEELINLYNNYVHKICTLKDITPWCSRKTITHSVLNPERTNEQKVFDAINESEVQEGDKILVYFTKEGTIKQAKDWQNDHDPYKLLEKLFKTVSIFESVVDKKQFINYNLKKKRVLLGI